MQNYYSYLKQYPKPLPKYHVSSDGSQVIDLTLLCQQELFELGYDKVDPPPLFEDFYFRIDWNGSEWIITENQIPGSDEKYNSDWDKIRRERNLLLKQSDYTQLADIPKDVQQEWAKYRQKLRDITQSVEDWDPAKVKFPDPPKTPINKRKHVYVENSDD